MLVKKYCTECMQIAIKNEHLCTQKPSLMALGMSMDYTKAFFFFFFQNISAFHLCFTYFKLTGLLFF